jgi:predicted nucleotidyltransferase
MSTIQRLTDRNLIKPPRWLPNNVAYETIMGSVAYGVSGDTSDMDIYGFCIPHKDDLFPHLKGEIPGFGRQIRRFDQFQQHHVIDVDALGGRGRSYDFSIYSIVKYFQLAMENNPNIIDSLFTPATCVLHSTAVGEMVRDRRKMFLHKGAWHKFKGYAYSQLHKIAIKNPTGKRADITAEHGFDTKFGYHVYRLISEVEQIMAEGDIDIQRDNEPLKAIRRGEWTEQQLREWFTDKEKSLERLYETSSLRHSPDETAIKQLLLDCLEHHYGNLSDCLVQPDLAVSALRNIQAELDRARSIV